MSTFAGAFISDAQIETIDKENRIIESAYVVIVDVANIMLVVFACVFWCVRNLFFIQSAQEARCLEKIISTRNVSMDEIECEVAPRIWHKEMQNIHQYVHIFSVARPIKNETTKNEWKL